MAIKDIYNNLSYKAKLALTQDADKFKEIVFNQLPRLLGGNKVAELLEIRQKINDKVNGLSPMNPQGLTKYAFLCLEMNHEVVSYAILNDKEEIFNKFKLGLQYEKTFNFLIENPNPKLLASIYNDQKDMPDIKAVIKNIIEKAIDKKDYNKIKNILDLFKSAEKYLDPNGQYYKTTESYLDAPFLDKLSQEYGKTLYPNDVQQIKKDFYLKVIQNNDMEALTNIMRDNNISLDRELVTNLITYDRADFLKSLLINPEFKINKENNANEVVSILYPDVLFLMAAKSGAMNTMKFAVEFNGSMFSEETLNYTLEMSVKNRNPQVVGYLLEDLGSHYSKEILNKVAQSALENKDHVMLKYMKDRSALIDVEMPNVVIESKGDMERKLESKIERLRNLSYPTKHKNDPTNTI